MHQNAFGDRTPQTFSWVKGEVESAGKGEGKEGRGKSGGKKERGDPPCLKCVDANALTFYAAPCSPRVH